TALRLVWGVIKLAHSTIRFFRNTRYELVQASSLFYRNRDHADLIQIVDLLPSDLEVERGFAPLRAGQSKELVFSSPTFDADLWDKDLALSTKSLKSNKINELIRRERQTLIPILTRQSIRNIFSKQFQNDKKLCLSDDINFNTGACTCHIGGYFDSFLTNEAGRISMLDG